MRITIEAANFSITYSGDEIPQTKEGFIIWCKRTLWDRVDGARVFDRIERESKNVG